MELWFSDYHTEKVKVSVKVQKQLFGLQTEFQRIDVFDSDEFGRFLSADGSIVFSEKDDCSSQCEACAGDRWRRRRRGKRTGTLQRD